MASQLTGFWCRADKVTEAVFQLSSLENKALAVVLHHHLKLTLMEEAASKISSFVSEGSYPMKYQQNNKTKEYPIRDS